MNRIHWLAPAIIAFAVLIVAANTFYVVKQTQQAIVLRVGDPVRVVIGAPPGPGPGAGRAWRRPSARAAAPAGRRPASSAGRRPAAG